MARGGPRPGAGRPRSDPALKATAAERQALAVAAPPLPASAMIAPLHLSDLGQLMFGEIANMLAEGQRAKGSGRKHEPVPVYLKRLTAKEEAVDGAKRQLDLDLAAVGIDREANSRDRAAIDAGFAELARAFASVRVERERLAGEAAALEVAKSTHAAKIAAHDHAMDAGRQRLASDRQAVQADAAAERRRLDAEREALEKARAAHAAKVAEDQRRLAADQDAVRAHLAQLATIEDELKHDMAELRTERAAMTRAMQATAELQQEAEADRAAAATERASLIEVGRKLDAHRDRLLPTLRAARDFRQQLAAVCGQALTPAASSTRRALDDLARAAASATAPSSEVRPEILAQYAHIKRQGTALGA